MHHIVEIANFAPIAHFLWTVVWDLTRYWLELRRKEEVRPNA